MEVGVEDARGVVPAWPPAGDDGTQGLALSGVEQGVLELEGGGLVDVLEADVDGHVGAALGVAHGQDVVDGRGDGLLAHDGDAAGKGGLGHGPVQVDGHGQPEGVEVVVEEAFVGVVEGDAHFAERGDAWRVVLRGGDEHRREPRVGGVGHGVGEALAEVAGVARDADKAQPRRAVLGAGVGRGMRFQKFH